ncbi:MAG TPA: TonB-dependent receptor, partial [Bacteroidales bacterium]|nr:TonB-dependent receptor [Bacteroidales bacterium]
RLVRNNFSLAENGIDTSFNFGNNDKPSRYFRDMQQFTSNSKIDFTLPFNNNTDNKGKIKFGGEYTYKNRDFQENLYDYSIKDAGNFYVSGNISDFFIPSLLGYVNGDLKNHLQFYSYPDNNYNAYQRLYAGYAMVDMYVFPKVKVTTGVRFEKTFMFLRSASDTTGKINTSDFLPSLAFTYEINEKTNLRASVTRTLARPSFREFSPLATFDFLGGYIQNGNSRLKRTLINNYDLRLEQYPAPGAYFGLSLFYKKFLNPIENAQLPGAGGSGSQFQYKNAKESQLYGAEFELRKNLGDFFSILDNFKINTNLTYVYSYVNVTDAEFQSISTWDNSPGRTRPMFNLSPYVVNASITYTSRDNVWESAIGFNVSGKRLIVYQVDLPSIYLQPRPELNFTIKKQLLNKIDIRFSAENLLNSPYEEQIGLADKVYYTTRYTTGRKFSVSLKYLFN